MLGADCTGRKATGPQEWFNGAMTSTPNAATYPTTDEAIPHRLATTAWKTYDYFVLLPLAEKGFDFRNWDPQGTPTPVSEFERFKIFILCGPEVRESILRAFD